ncbi:hypothetical protein [Kitasatospora saccharophila]|uniref:hypothetical protein n=1 Tax=Kitasatospora saccharophila TaxID=407973 RepID=UPI0031D0D80E
MLYHLAVKLNKHSSIPAHPGVPTSAALTEAAENAMTVMRHCTIRLDELGADADPARRIAARSLREVRHYAALANRHLAEALASAVALESAADRESSDPDDKEREGKLSYQVLNSAAVGYNSLIAALRGITSARDELLALDPPQPPAAARRPRSTPATSVQGQELHAGGRRR